MNIYDLKLHESVNISNSCTVTRVPGGWIYYTGNCYEVETAVFVPYNEEFKETAK